MSKKKILIVDDVSSNIHMLSLMLKTKYSIIAAKSGIKAIELANKDPKPDLILLDVLMPDMNGYEVCKELKSNIHTKDIPIIFVSSLNDLDEQKNAFNEGANDYLIKPVVRSELLTKIDMHIKSAPCIEPSLSIYKGKITMNNLPSKILIVDDAPQNIQIAVEILKDKYTVSVATSGEKALSMLDDGLNPDLILLDIIMPDMDGFQLCSILKENTNYCNIPIIFLSILENEHDMVRGLELGAVDYVTKPFEPKVLKARVNTHVKLKKYHDELLDNIKEKDNILLEQSKFAILGEMFENITHQWKQPLSIISMAGSSIRLESELNDLDDTSLDKYLTNMDNAVSYLSDTIDDFKDFIVCDRPKQYFKVKKIVSNSLKILDSGISFNNININIDLDEHEVFNYKNDFIQVLMNIFSNAIYALQKKDENKNIWIHSKLNNNIYTLIIKDNAGGINPDLINKIFDKYFTTKDSCNSSGLGLYMSKIIVEEKMQGKIEVESENGTTSFLIQFPFNQ